MIGLLLACLGGPSARAAGPEVWAALHDARLSQSADRDAAEAITIYETLLEHLAPDDPLRGELWIDLARARFDSGDEDGARLALTEAAQDPRVGARARAWLVQLEAWTRRVRHLPAELAVTTQAGPLVLGGGASADAGLEPGPEGLCWDTVVREGRDDMLMVALDEGAGPLHHLDLRLRARDFPAHVRVVVEDEGGARWATPVELIPPGGPVALQLDVVDLLPTGPADAEARPDPARQRLVLLQDVTAFHAADRGPNRICVATFSLR